METSWLESFFLGFENGWGTCFFLDICFCLVKAASYRGNRARCYERPLQLYIAILVTSLGGTTVSSILLGVAPGWIVSNSLIPTYVIVISTVFYSPGDFVYKLVVASPLTPILQIIEDFGWAAAITSWGVDNALRQPAPLGSSFVAAVLAGTLTGLGGSILSQAFSLHEDEWKFQTPVLLVHWSFPTVWTFSWACLYTLTQRPSRLRGLLFGGRMDRNLVYITVQLSTAVVHLLRRLAIHGPAAALGWAKWEKTD